MSSQLNRFCPYCLSALIGAVVFAILPEQAFSITPLGPLWLWLLAIPLGAAALKRVLMRSAQRRPI